MDSILSNGTWEVTDRPYGCKPVGCKWVFKKKLKPDGTIEKYKARLVAKGYTQSGLIPTQLNPNEWGGQPLVFWGRDTSKPLLALNDELEEKLQDNFCEYSEAAMRSLRMATEILSKDVPRVF
jgi:hypothetical protein